MRRHRRKSSRLPLALEAAALVVVFLGVNWCVQVLRKPSELARAFSPPAGKDPAATWKAYGVLFRRLATPVATPELLAALAQTESSGDPAAVPAWRWRWTLNPFRVFTPASTSVGLYQITDDTFARCRRLCVHYGRVEREREWYDPRGCWFNGLYNRLVPAHAVELVSACLNEDVRSLELKPGGTPTSLEREQDLAALVHLCGPRAAAVERVRAGRPVPKEWKCGEHGARDYLERVRSLRRRFALLRGG